jgi:hypothetical protein
MVASLESEHERRAGRSRVEPREPDFSVTTSPSAYSDDFMHAHAQPASASS